jgi:hypothetical protein
MQNEHTAHIEPLTFWRCACGTGNLSSNEYQHILACMACEILATEISAALDDIEKLMGRRHPNLGPTNIS